jgi:hypothetical protein
MPYISEAFVDKLSSLVEELRGLSDEYAPEDVAVRVHQTLVKMLIRSITDIEFDPESEHAIHNHYPAIPDANVPDEDEEDVYRFSLPPIPKLSKLHFNTSGSAAQALVRLPIFLQTRDHPVPQKLSKNCVVVFVHHAPISKQVDYDNRAFKVFLDQIAMVALASDSPMNIDLFQTFDDSTEEKTEVYLVCKSRFPSWIQGYLH